MGFPTINFAASGSDTAASGAGPATALTGSAASTSGDGLTVTLDGSPDLSGVATDGTHAIWVNDSTSGAQNWGKITAVDNGAKTVTVATAFGLSLTGKTWAIGGTRQTIAGSIKLFNQPSSASGDVRPGWILNLANGFTESFTAELSCRRDGDTTDGPIKLYCSGTAVLTFNISTASVHGVNCYGFYWHLEGIESRLNWSGTGNGGTAFYAMSTKRCRVSFSGSKRWATGISSAVNNQVIAENNYVVGAIIGIYPHSSAGNSYILCNYIDCGSASTSYGVHCINHTGDLIAYNIILNCTRGIFIQSYHYDKRIIGNTIWRSASEAGTTGIYHWFGLTAQTTLVANNSVTNFETAYGFSGYNATYLLARCYMYRGNNAYGYTTLITSGYEALWDSTNTTLDPQFSDPANGDVTVNNTTLRENAWPNYGIGLTTVRTYTDPGAIQNRSLELFLPTQRDDYAWARNSRALNSPIFESPVYGANSQSGYQLNTAAKGVAYLFVAEKSTAIKKVYVFVQATVGTPSNVTLTASIRAYSSSSAAGSQISTYSTTVAGRSSGGWVIFTFADGAAALTRGTGYYLCISANATDLTTDNLSLATGSAVFASAAYQSGSSYSAPDSSTWTGMSFIGKQCVPFVMVDAAGFCYGNPYTRGVQSTSGTSYRRGLYIPSTPAPLSIGSIVQDGTITAVEFYSAAGIPGAYLRTDSIPGSVYTACKFPSGPFIIPVDGGRITTASINALRPGYAEIEDPDDYADLLQCRFGGNWCYTEESSGAWVNYPKRYPAWGFGMTTPLAYYRSQGVRVRSF